MAGLVAFGTGTTSASLTLVSPPGKVDGTIGNRFTVIDSVTFTAMTTAGITAGTIEFQNNGAGQGQLLSAATTAANTPLIINAVFPGGLTVPSVSAGTVQVIASGFTGATQSRLIVTYHFE